ncbi:class II histone deacetylase [Microbacterium sp. CCNWLW134]|uniref:class II histone deacetylase n=1 Tax=Microbacterium sp. CCNWLW134 TaxID=3122064 RepID=UPI00300FFA5E
MSRVGFVTADAYFGHESFVDFGPDVEPGAQLETPEPRKRLLRLLTKTGAVDACEPIATMALTRADLERVHTREYLDAFERLSAGPGGELGDYAGFGHGSYEIAVLSAGGVTAAATAVWRNDVERAFALVRPPGHHAEPDRARGYCLLANIPIAVQHLRAHHELGRVAIIDWDVHHGNGAQRIYYSDPETLTVSVHQEELYPVDSGFITEVGEGPATGTNVNIPLPAGCGMGAYRDAFSRLVEPTVRHFRPDLLIVACGYDPGLLDPSSQMAVPARGFGEFTRRMMMLADELCGGRLVVAQEGGYSPLHSPFCGTAVVHALLGWEHLPVDPNPADDDAPEQRLHPWQAEAVTAAMEAARKSGALPR